MWALSKFVKVIFIPQTLMDKVIEYDLWIEHGIKVTFMTTKRSKPQWQH